MTPTDFNKRGKEKYDTNDYQGAIEDDTEAIKLDPNYAEADHNRGVARTAQGDKTGASEDYQKPQTRDTQPPRTTWAKRMPMVRAWSKMKPRRSFGIARPQTKDTQPHRPTLA